MSNISKKKREGSRAKIKTMGDHKEFLKRITKTLYYGHLPTLPCLSLPVTEISCAVWSETQRGRSLRRLHADVAARVARGACVSPVALVLALLYLERLHAASPDYLLRAAPQDLFLISLMVGNKFLQDDGEDDEVIGSEWAASGGIDLEQLNKLELEFLDAIDWNIFVNEESFEAGLSRLERQVALRQARTRGFFTYGDLTAACEGAELVRALGAACRALGALLAAALLLAHAAAPPLHRLLARGPAEPAARDALVALADREFASDLRTFLNNETVEFAIDALADELEATARLERCDRWSRYRRPRRLPARRAAARRLRAPALSGLYWGTLLSPAHRWLERAAEYAGLARTALLEVAASREAGCDGYAARKPTAPQHSVHRWLNLSKLGALLVTVSDR